MAVVDLESAVLEVLPKTQCEQCGYKGCRPYAKAVANGAPINLCVPGGEPTVDAIAVITKRPTLPVKPHENALPLVTHTAQINPETCIGCTKCLQVCPTDAIVGGPQALHSVIEEACTGCGLCVTPCPVDDCIEMIPNEAQAPSWLVNQSEAIKHTRDQWQMRRDAQVERKVNHAKSDTKRHDAKRSTQVLQADIQAALARARIKRQQQNEQRNP